MREKPDFLIIGVQKAGTSSLFEYLAQHPQVKVPGEKELHFFDLNYGKGFKWYRNQFPGKKLFKKSITGEASPYYIFHPLVPSRIKTHLPDTKLIVLFRDPAHRAYSHYQMQIRRNIEQKEFLQAVEFEQSHIQEEEEKIKLDPAYHSIIHQRFSYLNRGHYYEQITRWLKLFPRESFHFIKSEDLFSDPRKELDSIYDFLEIKRIHPSDLEARFTGDYTPLDPEISEYLNNYYREKNAKLQELISDKFQW
jgi:hypothetical protein